MRRHLRHLLLATLTLAGLYAAWKTLPTAQAADEKPKLDYTKDIAPLIEKYCVSCHGGAKPKGGVALNTFKSQGDTEKNLKIWEKVADNIRSGEMPPPDRKQLTAAELDLINSWLDNTVFKVNCDLREPGRVTIRRLNRAEYNNTIRDLVGVTFKPAEDFPSDDVGYGFDNIGDVLSMPPILMEKYLAAAEYILDEAIVPEVVIKPSKQTYRPQNLVVRPFTAKDKDNKKIEFNTNGSAQLQKFSFSRDGEYVIRIRANGVAAGKELPRMSVSINDKEVKAFDVTPKESKTYEVRLKQTEGERKIAISFLNPFKEEKPKEEKPKDGKDEKKDDKAAAKDDKAKDDKKETPKTEAPKEFLERKLIVEFFEVDGPYNAVPKPLPESTRRILIDKPTAKSDFDRAAVKVIENFARKAYRRPVQPDEVERLMRLFHLASSKGETFDNSIKLALQAVLVSPHFLFRIESDGDPKTPAVSHTISEFELATRLSYFLWSSMPDDELFRLAEQGKLRDSGVLETQVKRMLKDPKAKALTENFANQWLTLRNLREIKPDTKRFPLFSEKLREDMLEETALFFQHVIKEDRGILEFLDADYAFLNGRLAKLYNISGVNGNEFRKVTLTPEQHQQRGGLLMQASVLTVTSNPTRTSPVKRGKFILDNILGTPPPPPPPDVPELKEEGAELTGTLRQRMEQHRANPSCASCHQRLDPLGFGFENFDAIGGWRTTDGKDPIDPKGDLPGGKSFKGPAELRSILLERKEIFVKCLADKMLTYALGRGTKRTDQCFTDEIARNLAKQDYKFSALVLEIVKSDPFQKRGVRRGTP